MSSHDANAGIPDDDRYDLGILVVLRVLAQRWWLVAIVLALSLTMTVRRVGGTTYMFEASSQVHIVEASNDVVLGIAGYEAVDPIRTLDTQILTAQTQPVWQGVWDRLGLEKSQKIARLSVQKIGVSDIIEITVQSPDPAVAKEAATAFAESYVEHRKEQIADFYFVLSNTLASRAATYTDEVSRLNRQISDLSNTAIDADFYRLLASASSPSSALEASATLSGGAPDPELARLIAEREAALSLQQQLESRADEVGFEAGIRGAGPTIHGETSPPQGPIGTSVTRQLIVAVISGLAGGLALAFAVDYLDDKLRRRDRVERELVGIPVLGATPNDRSLGSRHHAVASLHRPVSATADAYRSIRATIIARSESTPVQTLLVTSPDPREGKTTVASELAVVMARSGRSVVLIDANLRRPRVHKRFGIAQEPGLSSVLVGDHGLAAGLAEFPLRGTTGRLRVLPAGPLSDGVTHVLDGQRTVEVLRAVQADADIVIVDAPHVNSISDAQVLAGIVDGVIVVARKKVTKRRNLGAALAALSKTGVPVVWTVLNGFGSKDRKAARKAARRATGTRRSDIRATETIGAES